MVGWYIWVVFSLCLFIFRVLYRFLMSRLNTRSKVQITCNDSLVWRLVSVTQDSNVVNCSTGQLQILWLPYYGHLATDAYELPVPHPITREKPRQER